MLQSPGSQIFPYISDDLANNKEVVRQMPINLTFSSLMAGYSLCADLLQPGPDIVSGGLAEKLS